MLRPARAALPRLPLGAAAALALALAGPAGAQAATFHLDGDTLVYTAAPGVQNWAHVELGADAGHVRINDSGDHLQPGAGCVLVDPADDTIADCPMPVRLRLELGDGDDRDTLRETLPALPITVLGEAGNDSLSANNDVDNQVTLDGGPGDDGLNGMQFNDTLLGGPGKDTLRGNGGDDTLHGGDGDDALEPDTYPDVIGNDLVDGGPGYDSVKDWGSTSEDPAFAVAVSVDGVPDDGRPSGEADNVIDVERIDAIEPGHYVMADSDDSIDLPDFGTSILEGRGGKDTLTGGDGVETIDGGPGDDRLEGGYNHDTITGGPGKDTIYGDETSQRCSYLSNCVVVPYGNDTIFARDGEQDVIDCGVGNDKAIVDAIDIVSNCESVDGQAAGSGSGGSGGATPGNGGAGGGGQKPTTTAASCKIPKKLKGLTLASAKKKLRAAHCTTIKTRKVKSRSVRKGRVVGASRKGRTVTVSISRGRR
jgi:Ca2+-binding RTX toxin-like protein